jgi:hypothetical protein
MSLYNLLRPLVVDCIVVDEINLTSFIVVESEVTVVFDIDKSGTVVEDNN